MAMVIVSAACTGCGTCSQACTEGAIAAIDTAYVIDPNRCCECGQCLPVCPTGAIQYPDEAEGSTAWLRLAHANDEQHLR